MTRPAGIFKLGNEYASLFGADYAHTPKAVYAAIAASLAMCVMGEGSDAERMDKVREAIRDEWRALHGNGIVPQRPLA